MAARRRIQVFHPLAHRREQAFALIDLVKDGVPLGLAARAVGVHRSTIFRWTARCEALAEAMDLARWAATAKRVAVRPRPGKRPRVPWHPECSCCHGAVVVRSLGLWMRIPYWCCERREACGWMSWLPRHPAG